jgi:methionine-rich copper-binding protein CopC
MTRQATGRALLAALLLASAPLVQAHAHPEHLRPAPGATVAAGIDSVSIEFSENLEPAFSSIVVSDARGHALGTGKATLADGNRKAMRVGVQPLAAGTYTVKWIAVADDGHRTQGQYAFAVK